MAIQAILFDLDGSLLPMDQDAFVREYFKRLAIKIAPLGFDPAKTVNAVVYGTGEMIKNDGAVTNEERFWVAFEAAMGPGIRAYAPYFEDFYRNEFNKLISVTEPTPLACECVKAAKAKGYITALATNPMFPRIGTLSRVGWAGLDPSDFDLITTYEDFNYCKPDLRYYRQVAETLGVSPEACLMAGNDVSEDMCAAKIGMGIFLLDDCLINKENRDISAYRRGGLGDLLKLIGALPELT